MRRAAGRWRALGYVLLVLSGGLMALIAVTRPPEGRALLAVAVILGLLAAGAIWRANALRERS